MQSPDSGLTPARVRRRVRGGRIGNWIGTVAVLMLAVLAGARSASADQRGAVLVVDANTGNTLYASSADEPRYPASLTKMMTLYMVFDLIERGRLSYRTPIRVSANAAGAAPSKLDLKEGEEIALIDAIRVLITKSANDVAIAVAEHIGGSEGNFARLMTQKAHQIGMKGTTFRNASGLPDPQQVTTARDMATLALRLQDEFPQHYVLFGTRTFSYKGETFKNHNTLLFHYEGSDGIKTGYTRASGFNLVSSVRRGNKHVIGVVFGGASAATRNTAMRTYLNIGLVKAASVRSRKGTPALVARSAVQERVAQVPAPRRAEPPAPEAAPVRETAAQAPAPTLAAAPAHAPAAQPGPAPAAQRLTMVRVRTVPLPEVRTAAGTETASVPARLAPPKPLQPAIAQVPAAPGSAPSSLGAQAARLARGEPPAARAPREETAAASKAHVAGVAPAPGQPRFHVQIGAFPSAQEAERQLAAVKARAAMLAQARPLTQAVQQGDKTLYRARYAGLDSTTANQACDDLKAQGLSCLVFKGE